MGLPFILEHFQVTESHLEVGLYTVSERSGTGTGTGTAFRYRYASGPDLNLITEDQYI